MKNFFYSIMALSLFAVSCTPANTKEIKVTAVDTTNLIKRGEYLVNSMGCHDCHSPKAMGPKGPEIIADRALSGYTAGNPLPDIDTNSVKKGWTLFSPDFTAAVGPWGVSFAGNITGDETGIGNWSEENFRRALRQGKYKGLENSRDLLPPMPWQVFKNFTDEDIKSIYLYLKSTNPVENVVPNAIPFAKISNTKELMAVKG